MRKQVNKHVSKAIGMELNVGRIDLRFPLNLLVRDVDIVQHPDTLLMLGSLNVRVQLMPLFKGQIDVNKLELDDVKINSANLIDGIKIQGELGRFYLQSHGINLSKEQALVNQLELSDTNIKLILNDTTTTEKVDTTSTKVNWVFDITSVNLKNISFEMETPADSMTLATRLESLDIKDVNIDLRNESYGLRNLLLDNTSFKMNIGASEPTAGFDPTHLSLNNINLEIDSALYHGRDIKAIIKECSMYERSGLSITSLTTRVFSDSTLIQVPYFKLLTPHSSINLTAQTYWELINIPTTGRLGARLDAQIGKQDVLLFAGNLSERFKEEYPFRPLIIQAGTDGNLKQMQISRIRVDLPGALSIDGGGELYNRTVSLTRSANIDLQMKTQNLGFLTTLADLQPGDPLVIPDSMFMDVKLGMEGPQLDANLLLREGIGSLVLQAGLNLTTEDYKANLKINNLQVDNFLPKDSIYGVTASFDVAGKGLNPVLPKSTATLNASIDKLQYTKFDISGITLNANIKNSIAHAKIVSDNSLLKMKADAEYNLASSVPDGKVDLDVTYVNLC